MSILLALADDELEVLTPSIMKKTPMYMVILEEKSDISSRLLSGGL